MILLRNVSIRNPNPARQHLLLDSVSLLIPDKSRIGILAPPGSGKSTIARVLSGIDKPHRGYVHTSGRVSWPLGFAGFLHPHVSIEKNLRTIAGLTGQPLDQLYHVCALFLGQSFDMRETVMNLSPSARAALAYACCLAVPWDHVIADETITIGTSETRALCEAALERHLQSSGLIFLSRNARQLEQFCDSFFVLAGGRLRPCSDLAVAEDMLEMMSKETCDV